MTLNVSSGCMDRVPADVGRVFLEEQADEAIRLTERALAEDPLEVWPRMSLHAYLQAAGRDREAFEQVKKVLEIDPDLVVARVSVAHFHAPGESSRRPRPRPASS